MALGACRGSGRSLIFLNTRELRALDAFTTPVFSVQGNQGAEGPQGSEHTLRKDTLPHTHRHPKLAFLRRGPLLVSLPQILAYNTPWLPTAQR